MENPQFRTYLGYVILCGTAFLNNVKSIMLEYIRKACGSIAWTSVHRPGFALLVYHMNAGPYVTHGADLTWTSKQI